MSTTPVGYLYTPQQLMGSVKYSSGVLLGNWREDDAIDEMVDSLTDAQVRN